MLLSAIVLLAAGYGSYAAWRAHRGLVTLNVRDAELRTVIRNKGLSNLSVPREVKFLREIPLLGTGKVHHRELARLVES